MTPVNNSYIAGEYLNFMIYAKDIHGNNRPLSLADPFTVSLYLSTLAITLPVSVTSNLNGTYTIHH
jgi:hypothetical protein